MSIAYRLGALILVLGLLLGGSAYIVHLRSELAQAEQAAKTAQEALKRTQATLAYREKLRAATARRGASARASLAAAAASNPTWASAPVPQEVQDALCAHLSCASPDGLRSGPTDDSS